MPELVGPWEDSSWQKAEEHVSKLGSRFVTGAAGCGKTLWVRKALENNKRIFRVRQLM